MKKTCPHLSLVFFMTSILQLFQLPLFSSFQDDTLIHHPKLELSLFPHCSVWDFKELSTTELNAELDKSTQGFGKISLIIVLKIK